MKATVQRSDGASYTHAAHIRNHRLIIDEPLQDGGRDQGPSPQELLAASLAGCVAITTEMYAQRKGWDIGNIGVEVELDQPQPGTPAHFAVNLLLPAGCSDEQRERLRVIATRCPIHRLLEGEVSFEERITIVEEPAS